MAVRPPRLNPPQVPRGFRAGTAACGIKPGSSRADLALIVADGPCVAAGMFTQNAFRAACVRDAERRIRAGVPIQVIAVNSGNANCANGPKELAWTRAMAEAAARAAGADPEQAIAAHTGVIGEPLPIARIEAKIPEAAARLSASPEAWMQAADAIRTTDTFAKWASARIGDYTLIGIAKGSGMIHPNMATMLAFFATDMPLDHETLDQALRAAVEQSFNCISVDGDTSTNDMAVALAPREEPVRDGGLVRAFAERLAALAQALAEMIVRDGEGVSKFVTIRITGARSFEEARAIGRRIATSPLVKTAFAGSDANWGRIVCAIGNADAPIAPERVSIWADDVRIVRDGARDPDYREEDGMRVFARDEFTIRVDLGLGDAEATVWTGDLTHEYIRINAEYRT